MNLSHVLTMLYIYKSFIRYTNLNNSSFDKDFTDKLFTLRPDWKGRKGKSIENKNTFLLMAENNEPKPSSYTRYYIELSRYTNPKSPTYDAEFTKKLLSIQPDSWMTIKEKLARRKEALLTMAKNNEPRPEGGSKECLAIARYTHPRKSSYDAEFTKKLLSLKPEYCRSYRKVVGTDEWLCWVDRW